MAEGAGDRDDRGGQTEAIIGGVGAANLSKLPHRDAVDRSTLVAQDPITITHLFACPNCHQLAESKSSARTPIIPPGKLSAPQHLRAA